MRSVERQGGEGCRSTSVIGAMFPALQAIAGQNLHKKPGKPYFVTFPVGCLDWISVFSAGFAGVFSVAAPARYRRVLCGCVPGGEGTPNFSGVALALLTRVSFRDRLKSRSLQIRCCGFGGLLREWAERDSNSHGRSRHILSVVRLPISPSALGFSFAIIATLTAI